MVMSGYYDPTLVVLSIAVAILASFTALNLAARLLASDKNARRWWLIAAAIALGGGIWSMHFVGMLAFIMPMPVSYDLDLTLLSLLLPIVVVGAGLFIIARFGNGVWPLLAAGLLAGTGIVVMHYGGMAAMRMPGVSITYDPTLFTASVLIALLAATAAFWLAFRNAGVWENAVAATVMGLAISGMHYTGMAAAEFVMDRHDWAMEGLRIEPGYLAMSVVGASAILLLLGLVTAFFDRKLATLTAKEAAALTKSEQRLRALHKNASDVVIVLDRTGVVTYEASSAARILGYETADLVGRRFADFVEPSDAGAFTGFLAMLLAETERSATAELKARHARDGWRDMEIVGRNFLGDPAIEGIVLNMRDVSERKRFVAELERLAETDIQTGILNRRGFWNQAGKVFERASHSPVPLTLVMIDIDYFKSVNDNFGHAAGDMVLAMVADAFRNAVRDTDILARFGGEEFIVLLIDGDHEQAREIVDRLRASLAKKRVATIKGEIAITASFGMVTVDASVIDLELAIRFADEALYEAKNAGRDCVRVRA